MKKVATAVLNANLTLFKIAQKLPNIWATFVRKFAARNNLATLHIIHSGQLLKLAVVLN